MEGLPGARMVPLTRRGANVGPPDGAQSAILGAVEMLKQARTEREGAFTVNFKEVAQEETQDPQQRLEETQASQQRLQAGPCEADSAYDRLGVEHPDRDQDDDAPQPVGLAAAAGPSDGPYYWAAGRQVPATGPDGRSASAAAAARAQSGKGQEVAFDRALREAFEEGDADSAYRALMAEAELESDEDMQALVAGLLEACAVEVYAPQPRGRFSSSQAGGRPRGRERSGQEQWLDLLRGAFSVDAAVLALRQMKAGYRATEFQRELQQLREEEQESEEEQGADGAAEVLAGKIDELRWREVDQEILPQFGFSATPQGQASFRSALDPYLKNSPVAELEAEIQELLGRRQPEGPGGGAANAAAPAAAAPADAWQPEAAREALE